MVDVKSKSANTKIVIKYRISITMKQSGDFVMNTSNQIWLMLNQKSANTKVVINNHVLITNETNGRFCAEHKQPEMVDVISKCCEYEGCNKGRIQ
jgi:hypothetical protein